MCRVTIIQTLFLVSIVKKNPATLNHNAAYLHGKDCPGFMLLGLSPFLASHIQPEVSAGGGTATSLELKHEADQQN